MLPGEVFITPIVQVSWINALAENNLGRMTARVARGRAQTSGGSFEDRCLRRGSGRGGPGARRHRRCRRAPAARPGGPSLNG